MVPRRIWKIFSHVVCVSGQKVSTLLAGRRWGSINSGFLKEDFHAAAVDNSVGVDHIPDRDLSTSVTAGVHVQTRKAPDPRRNADE